MSRETMADGKGVEMIKLNGDELPLEVRRKPSPHRTCEVVFVTGASAGVGLN